MLDVLEDFTKPEFLGWRRLDADGDQGDITVWRLASSLISENVFIAFVGNGLTIGPIEPLR